MASRGTGKLLSQGRGEDLGNCCPRPQAAFPEIFSKSVIKLNKFLNLLKLYKFAEILFYFEHIYCI
jgi:hypothetical protein